MVAHRRDLGLTPAEVYGTATFYDMIFTEPVGPVPGLGVHQHRLPAERRLRAARPRRADARRAGRDATPDGEFTLEEVECIALCGKAPCLTVNWRFFGEVGHDGFDRLVGRPPGRRLSDIVPPHGTLCRVRRAVGLLAGGPASASTAEPGRPRPAEEAP